MSPAVDVGRNLMRRATILVVAACLGLTASCSEGEPAATPSPTPTSGGAPEPTAEPTPAAEPPPVETNPKKVLRTAIRNLVDANTGNVSVGVVLTATETIKETGDYQISPVRADLTRTISSSAGSVEFRFLTFGRTQWLRLVSVDDDDGKAWPCWVDVADVSRLGEVEGLGTPAAGPPAAIGAATFGVGRRFVYGPVGDIAGTTDLALALGLVGGTKLLALFGIDPNGTATIPATFQRNGDILTGFEVDLGRIPAALTAAGLDGGSLEASGLSKAAAPLVAFFGNVGRPVEISAPKADEIVAFDRPDDFEPAMRSCGKGVDAP